MKHLAVFISIICFSISIFGQEPEAKTIESKSMKVEATRGEDPNIKADRPTIDNPVPKPEIARGEYCKVIVDNWTGYAIDIYVDGEYAGTVGAWGDGYTWAIEGQTELYGKSTGGTLAWGPVDVDCYYEHTWKLTE